MQHRTFDISRRTLFGWRAKLKYSKRVIELQPKSSRPIASSEINPLIIKKTKEVREIYPNKLKDKILHLQDFRDYCNLLNCEIPSISTIGRIIAKDPFKMRYSLKKTLYLLNIPKHTKYTARALLEVTESVESLRAKALSSSTNNHSKIPITILSGNGSEFHKELEALIVEKKLEHLWTYPRSPKQNAHMKDLTEQYKRASSDIIKIYSLNFQRDLKRS